VDSFRKKKKSKRFVSFRKDSCTNPASLVITIITLVVYLFLSILKKYQLWWPWLLASLVTTTQNQNWFFIQNNLKSSQVPLKIVSNRKWEKWTWVSKKDLAAANKKSFNFCFPQIVDSKLTLGWTYNICLNCEKVL
jgi:hypothetical protein